MNDVIGADFFVDAEIALTEDIFRALPDECGPGLDSTVARHVLVDDGAGDWPKSGVCPLFSLANDRLIINLL